MKRLAIAAVPLFAACSAAAAAEPEYRALPLPPRAFAVPQGVFADELQRFPAGREGRQRLELEVVKLADGTYFVLLRQTGLLDDSVEGSERRAVMSYSEGGWRAAELGERWRCHPARGPRGWTIDPCR